MTTRLGVDVGGTFTDLIFYDDETGEICVGKEPTTPAAPEEGVHGARLPPPCRRRCWRTPSTSCTGRRSG